MNAAATLGPYLLVAGLAAIWALAEILQTFPGDIRRALKTGWSLLLIGLNVGFAVAVYVLVEQLLPAPVNPWLEALAVGVGWQALLRTRVNLLQPLNAEAGASVSISLADLYGRLQQFCREQIDQSLAVDRRRLLDRASRLPVEELERQLRLLAHASQFHPPEEVEEYIEKLRQYPSEQQALLMASYLLREGGYDFLRNLVKDMEKRS